MSSFLTFLVTPAVKQVTKKPILGKPYTIVGSLFGVIGWWVYQQGGVLGYVFRDNPSLLAKLAAPPGITVDGSQIIKELKELSSEVESRLKENETEEKTLFHLYTFRELRNIGIDPSRGSLDENLKKLREKVHAEVAGDVMRMAFAEGIAFGFHFPEQFAVYWDNTHRMIPDSKWQELRQRGIILSERQHNLKLNEAIVELAEAAVIWDKSQSTKMLDSNDISILKGIIEANKGL